MSEPPSLPQPDPVMSQSAPPQEMSQGTRQVEVIVMASLFVVLAVLFRAFPEIDLTVAQWFYQEEGGGFYSPENWWLALPYYGMPRVAQAAGLFFFLRWLGAFWFSPWKARQRWYGFLLLALLVGPHLIVGIGLKEQVGRARPANITEFGGGQTFTPAFVISDQCQRNCAFVSAHVASASFVMAFGWFAGGLVRRRWLWGGVLGAGLLGLARMAQGGHFLSDVVFAYFCVYAGCWVTEWVFRQLGWLPENLTPGRS